MDSLINSVIDVNDVPDPVFEFLLDLNLAERFYKTFVDEEIDLEALLNASDSQLQSIGIPAGPRIKILKKAEELKNNVLEAVHSVSEEVSKPNEDSNETLPITNLNNNEEASEQNETLPITNLNKNEDKPGTSADVDVAEKEDLFQFKDFDLKKFLENNLHGRKLCATYNRRGYFEESDRNLLVSIISDYFISQHVRLTNKELETLSSFICEIFTTESIETYFVPPRKLEFPDGTKKTKVAGGKLTHKYRNNGKKFIDQGLLTPRKKRKLNSKIENEEEAHEENEGPVEENYHQQWLKINRYPLNDVLEHWRKTLPLRIKSKAHSVASFLEDWPILKYDCGPTLVLDDFEKRFLDRCLWLHNNYNAFFFKIVNSFSKGLKSPQCKLWLEKVKTLENPGSADPAADLLKFLLLPHLLPPKGKVYSEKFYKPSAAEVESAFISLVRSAGSIKETIDERKALCSQKGMKLQPFILVVHEEYVPKESYVVIDTNKWLMENILQAVDVCFKSFFVLNAAFGADTEYIWLLIQRGIFKMKTKYDGPVARVTSILNQIKVSSNDLLLVE